MNRTGISLSCVIVLTLTFLTTSTAAQQLTTAPDPGAPLDSRWQWGVSQGQASTTDFWVGYQVEFLLDERLGLNLNSHRHSYYEWNHLQGGETYDWADGNMSGWQSGASLAALQEGAVSHQQSFMQPRSMLVLTRYGESGIQHMRLHAKDDVVNWQELPVYWLGSSTDEESYGQLASMLDPQQSALNNMFLFRVLGLHAYSERDDLLQNALSDSGWQEQHATILEAVVIRQRPILQTQLLDIAKDENADLVMRRIAISALSRISSVDVVNSLITLAGHLNPQAIRLEALESLAAFDAEFYSNYMQGTDYMTIFTDIVWSDNNSRVRTQALRCLASYRTPEAHALLLRVAREHEDRSTRTSALEQLQRNLL